MVSTPILLDDIFQQAVSGFEASLTDKQRREFQGCTRKDVEAAIQGIQNLLASERKQRNIQKIAKFVEGIPQLAKVIEVFVNCDSTVAFVWGPVKFVLLAAGTWVESLDCLLEIYAEIGEFLPGLSQYEKFLSSHPTIGVHLRNYYCDVLEFHRKALSVFSRPGWKTAFHSAWKTFKTQFGPILAQLKRHRDLLSDEKITAALSEVHDFRQSFEDKLNEISRQLQKFHLDNDQESAERYREALDRRRDVLSRLSPPCYRSDLEKALRERQTSTSGDWLRTHTAFCRWTDLNTREQRALYLNGIPGTGKTVLASVVVHHLEQMREGCGENDRKFSVLYFFFKHGDKDKRTFSAMLQFLISQLVHQDDVVLDLVYQRLIQVDQQKIRSVSFLRELGELVLRTQSLCFVVVDGLDECVEDEATDREDAQREVIDWLEGFITTSNPGSTLEVDDPQPDERCIRVLISGQRNGVLDARLKHWPAIQIDSSPAHSSDIEAYATAMSLQIQRKFRVDEAERLTILDRVNTRAKGMFLYAKVVLQNLLWQHTRGHFKIELRDENFPKGMDQARILGLVLCAVRPLLWKEIQSRFCIDIEFETADPDFQLLEPCKKYCGSIVEVAVNEESCQTADETVELVHETARTYLLCTGRFRLADLHKEMALFCAQYISSAPFNPDKSDADVRKHCVTGYYGFLDYAVAYWWKHFTRLGVSLDQGTMTSLYNLLNTLKGSSKEDGQAPASDISTAWSRIQQLRDDGRDWESLFPAEQRIKPIRDCLESLFNSPRSQDLEELKEVRELYGRVSYKCTKPWCHFFLLGFDAPKARQYHMAQHARPFRCNIDDCFGCQIGFATESGLAKHNNRVHCQVSSKDFPSAVGNADIFEAAKKGKLDILQALVCSGANVNARSDNRSTPLFLAADAGHYQVCRWLLEQGAKVNARCTRLQKTALHAAVANNDLDLVRLLIDHGADVHDYGIRSNGGMRELMKRRSDPDHVSAAFPEEFWAHGSCSDTWCKIQYPEGGLETLRQITTQELNRAANEGDAGTFRSLLLGPHPVCLDLNQLRDAGDISGSGGSILHTVLASGSKNRSGQHEQCAAILMKTGRIDLDLTDRKGNLALHYACMMAYPVVTSQLFVLTNFPNTRNRARKTPSDLLLRCAHEANDDEHARRVSLISELLASGFVNVNLADPTGGIPLRRACKVSSASIVSLLLPHTRLVNLEDHNGRTAYQLALDRGNLAVIAVMLKRKMALLHDNSRAMTAEERSYLDLAELVAKNDPTFLSRPCRKAPGTEWPGPPGGHALQVYEQQRLLLEKKRRLKMMCRQGQSFAIGLTILQCGAYYLDAPIIRTAISLKGRETKPALPFWDPPPDWQNGLFSMSDYVDGGILSNPLFIAMNSALHEQNQTEAIAAEAGNLVRARFREVFDALLSIPHWSLPYSSPDVSERAQQLIVRLIDACCDTEMVGRMAKAGLSLPWTLFRWKEGDEVWAVTGALDKSPDLDFRLSNSHMVLSFAWHGHCRFLDILRENYAFAVGMVGPEHIMPGRLNFDDEKGILISLIAKQENVAPVLRNLLQLGFDGMSGVLHAAQTGCRREVEVLLKSQDEAVMKMVDDAFHKAVEKGFSEAAEMLQWRT